MSVPVDRKPERAVQAKIRGIQKIYSRWIENPKGRSRKKLGILKKMMMRKEKKTKTEASQFKWVKWKNALCASSQIATSVSWLIDGFYPKKWRLLPVVWLMTSPACGLIDGDLYLWFVWWRLMSVVCVMETSASGLIKWQLLPYMIDWWALLPRNDDFCQWFDYGLLPLQWFD